MELTSIETNILTEQVVERIRSVYDPEIPINIYELGLIYSVVVDTEGHAEVEMTLTSPACPAAQSLPGEVYEKVKSVPGITGAHVEVVWEPQWTMDRMTDEAKLELGMW